MKLANTKIKTTTTLESVTLELTPREFDMVLHSVGNCPTLELERRMSDITPNETTNLYCTLIGISEDLKEYR